MSVDRLFQMIHLLMERSPIPAKELAEKFEVSIRTIYRDLDVLSGAGIPVYALPGRGGGISLLPGYVLDKSLLSKEEQMQLLMGVKSLSAAYPLSSGLAEKLGSLMQMPVADWIAVDFSRWGYEQQDNDKFETLRQAIWDKRLITFWYNAPYGDSGLRIVKPARLVYKSSAWYLQAFCLARQDYRTFKVHRISTLLSLPQHFTDCLTSPPIEQMAPNIHVSTTSFVLSFSSCVENRVYDEFAPEQIVREGDGRLTVTMQAIPEPSLYGYFLSYGDALKILASKSAVTALRQIASSILKSYENAKM